MIYINQKYPEFSNEIKILEGKENNYTTTNNYVHVIKSMTSDENYRYRIAEVSNYLDELYNDLEKINKFIRGMINDN